MARWVACEVNFTKLLEVQELFVTSSEPQFFIRYCCPWLLPPLVLRRDISNLEWLSKTISQPLPLLAKEYFVPIFAMCMAVYCNERPGKEFSGATVRDSILLVAKVSERERDDLIKRNMPLQDHCCTVLSALLEVFKAEPTAEAIYVLGEQLQFLISKLVACCIPSRSRGNGGTIPSSGVINLLCQLTVDADPSLYVFIKDLEPFPELDCLRRIRIFHGDLCKAYSARDRFLMFVRRSPHLPRELLLLSLQILHKRLLMNEIIPQNSDAVYSAENANRWNSDPEIVNAVWNLFQLIGSDDANDISGFLADFISRVGIGEPYQVVFRLPENDKLSQSYAPASLSSSKKIGLFSDVCITDDLLISLLRLLNKDLLDNSVKIVDIASQTLQALVGTILEAFLKSVFLYHQLRVSIAVVCRISEKMGKRSNECKQPQIII